MDKIIRLIGAPCGVGGRVLGAEDGPKALREGGVAQSLIKHGYGVENTLDLTIPESFSYQGAGFHNISEILAWIQNIKPTVFKTLQAGYFPIVMGGDHTISIGSIAAAKEFCAKVGKKLIVLWLDAHGDFNTPEISLTGNIHGMPLATLCGFGDDRLIEAMGAQNCLNPLDVYEVGLRALDPEEKIFLQQKGIHTYGMDQVSELEIEAVIKEILKPFWNKEDVYLHVSFDIDFLDASLVPGTGTPEINGPTLKDAQACFKMIAASGILGSLDIVELNPRLDPSGKTICHVVDLIPLLFTHPESL